MKPTQAQNAPVSAMTPAQIAERARAARRFGIDTEFVSESRYRALLGLVQVVVELPDGRQHIELLDPIEGFGAGRLADIWADPDVEVVIHSGGQDVAILRRAWGAAPTNVFDTQVAAGFAGFSAQAGYGNLLQAALGVRLAKSAGFTRWDRRPLTEEQLDYARKDVEDLLALTDELQRRFREGGGLDWAREECRRLEDISDERDADSAYRRLPRGNQLRPRARAIARPLAGPPGGARARPGARGRARDDGGAGGSAGGRGAARRGPGRDREAPAGSARRAR